MAGRVCATLMAASTLPARSERGRAGDHRPCERRSPDHGGTDRVLPVDVCPGVGGRAHLPGARDRVRSHRRGERRDGGTSGDRMGARAGRRRGPDPGYRTSYPSRPERRRRGRRAVEGGSGTHRERAPPSRPGSATTRPGSRQAHGSRSIEALDRAIRKWAWTGVRWRGQDAGHDPRLHGRRAAVGRKRGRFRGVRMLIPCASPVCTPAGNPEIAPALRLTLTHAARRPGDSAALGRPSRQECRLHGM